MNNNVPLSGLTLNVINHKKTPEKCTLHG